MMPVQVAGLHSELILLSAFDSDFLPALRRWLATTKAAMRRDEFNNGTEQTWAGQNSRLHWPHYITHGPWSAWSVRLASTGSANRCSRILFSSLLCFPGSAAFVTSAQEERSEALSARNSKVGLSLSTFHLGRNNGQSFFFPTTSYRLRHLVGVPMSSCLPPIFFPEFLAPPKWRTQDFWFRVHFGETQTNTSC